MSAHVEWLKLRMRHAFLHYRRAAFHLDCGAAMAATISPAVRDAAISVNAIARELQELDPNFPSDWQPYPEGN